MDSEHDEDDDDDEDESRGGIPSDLIASYLAFAGRAILRRRWLVAIVFVVVSGLVVGVLSIWPRTYRCQTRLMAESTQALSIRGDPGGEALRGASNLILGRQTLEAIAKQTDLVHAWQERRPPAAKLKDEIMAKLRGKPDDRDVLKGLVFTLESKLTVDTADGTLSITVDWPDGGTAARIVEAAQQNFLEMRHVAEISTIAEYIAILEGHATTLRAEIEQIAQQIKDLRKQGLDAAQQKLKAGAKPDAEPPAISLRRIAVRTRVEPDEELARMKVLLEAKQRAISELEDYRNRRLLELEAKMTELRSKYTAAYPAIQDMDQNIKSLSHETPQVTALRAEVRDLQSELQRRAQAATGGGSTFIGGGSADPSSGGGGGGAAPLPADIMNLMEESARTVDPAVAAQLGYAVEKFATIRSQISSARIDLDTAQAAFKHRYKVIVPADTPLKPIKPKVSLITFAGLAGALLLGILTALAAELRSGKIVEQWQVQRLALPVLANLRFPPGSED